MRDIFKSLKDVSDKLGDRISKEIYANKLMYNITGDLVYLRNIFNIIDKEYDNYDLLPNFRSHKKQPKVIFGCGRQGVFLKKLFPEINWKCFVDNKALPGMMVENIPVISVEELRLVYPEAYIIVSPRHDYENIARQLEENFFVDNNIYLYGEKQDFLASKTYFDLPYLSHSHDEVFVDAGGLDGNTSLDFVRWCSGEYSHIHIFEPNVNDIPKIKKSMMSIGDKYTLYEMGLWNCAGKMNFFVNENELSTARIVENSQQCEQKINVMDLDTALHGKRVTFIKMDIEGAEKQALEGAQNIIRKYHPKLAISIYHKPDDLYEIPKIILGFSSEYKFYIRHYCLNSWDTVLYAI